MGNEPADMRVACFHRTAFRATYRAVMKDGCTTFVPCSRVKAAKRAAPPSAAAGSWAEPFRAEHS